MPPSPTTNFDERLALVRCDFAGLQHLFEPAQILAQLRKSPGSFAELANAQFDVCATRTQSDGSSCTSSPWLIHARNRFGTPSNSGERPSRTKVAMPYSARSAFTGFLQDELTTLPETTDRILATSLTATWQYRPADLNFDITWRAVRQTLLDTFAPVFTGLRRAAGANKADLVARWRLESAEAIRRFLQSLARTSAR